jgi:hypothetical protein
MTPERTRLLAEIEALRNLANGSEGSLDCALAILARIDGGKA